MLTRTCRPLDYASLQNAPPLCSHLVGPRSPGGGAGEGRRTCLRSGVHTSSPTRAETELGPQTWGSALHAHRLCVQVLKENIQEIYVDKVVERVVEVLREVYVDKVVQRRIEVL